jgi:hypothetical protein
MSFLYPAFLIGGLAIALPIVLHLLRRDVAPEVPFTAVRLLRRSPVERVHTRRLRDLLLLVARIAALLLLAAAFARPYLRGATPSALRVVAIDRSFSMAGAERFARALDLARRAIDEAPAGERVALVAFDDRAELLSGPAGKEQARAALEGLQPTLGATRYPAVFDKVVEIAAGAAGQLVVVTDLQPSGWDRQTTTLPPGWRVDVRAIDAPSANLSVTDVSVNADGVGASVRNSGTTARTGRLRAALDGRVAANAAFTLAPGETRTVPIALRTPATGALTVSLDDPDGLPADDVRYVALGGKGTPRVLVIGGGGQSGLFLSRALETSRGEEGAVDADVVTGAQLMAMPAEELSAYSLIALLSTRGLDRRSRDALASHVRNGAGMLVTAAEDVDVSVLASMTDWRPPLAAREQAEPQTLAATDLRHPVFRPFGALAANLGQVRFERSWRIDADGWTIVARFSNGTPALLERALGRGRVVLFGSDLDRRWNDFPLHPAFVPFAFEAVRHAMSGSGDRRQARTYTVAEAPQGTGPGPGVFRTGDNQIVAVNVDPTEGRLERMSAEAFGQKVQSAQFGGAEGASGQARQTEGQQNYWRIGLMLMLLALVGESFVGRS